MSALIYDGNQITPAPLVTISRQMITNTENKNLGSIYNISLNGVIVATSGNGGMSYVTDEIKSLKSIFSKQNGLLELVSPDNPSSFMRFFCTVNSFDIQDGTWYDIARYTVSLTSNQEISEDVYEGYVSQATEDWDITQENNGVYAISHNLSAIGLVTSGVTPIENAKNWCASKKISINSNGVITYLGNSPFPISSGTITNSNFSQSGYWNYASIEKAGSSDGSWQLQETLIWYSGVNKSREEYTISVNIDNEASFDNGNIQIQGTVFGLASMNNSGQTKLNNAKYDFDNTIKNELYSRVSYYAPSGMSVSPVGTASSRTYDITNGTLAYSYTYPATYGSLVQNAFNEVLEVTDNGQNDVFAEISIPGRISGPIVQNMGTKTLAGRTVTYSAQFPGSGGISVASLTSRYLSKPSQSAINPIFNALRPAGANYYVVQNTENWNPRTFIYSKTMGWTIVATGDYTGNIGSGLSNPQ